MEKNNHTIYCELMTKEDVIEFEKILYRLGINELSRPMTWAKNPPQWYRENRERKPDEDPLAIVSLSAYGMIDSGYRECDDKAIEVMPFLMKNILLWLEENRKRNNSNS